MGKLQAHPLPREEASVHLELGSEIPAVAFRVGLGGYQHMTNSPELR